MAIRSELILDGITNPITVHICNVNINQPVDASNRPNSSPRAGIIRLTISRVTLHHLREWAIDPNMRKGGEVRYVTDSGNSQTSILFHDAYCIDYSERFNSVNTESLTVDLTISAHRILFGGDLRIVNAWPGIVTPQLLQVTMLIQVMLISHIQNLVVRLVVLRVVVPLLMMVLSCIQLKFNIYA